MSSNVVQGLRPLLKNLKPVLSTSGSEARKRVLNLYKLWYRQVPYVVLDYDVPITVEIGRKRLRQEFDKNKKISDIRAVDLLVAKVNTFLIFTET
jgi:NADH dehydrogenase (ubiquinone) 1 alpha subcomplex subunit 6